MNCTCPKPITINGRLYPTCAIVSCPIHGSTVEELPGEIERGENLEVRHEAKIAESRDASKKE